MILVTIHTFSGKIKLMFQPEVLLKIEQELSRGESARQQGLEGRARVCARRAAGIAARAYLESRGLPLPGTSVMDLLACLQSLPGLSPGIQQAVEHLLTRVNESCELPPEIDLLAIVRRLVHELQAT